MLIVNSANSLQTDSPSTLTDLSTPKTTYGKATYTSQKKYTNNKFSSFISFQAETASFTSIPLTNLIKTAAVKKNKSHWKSIWYF